MNYKDELKRLQEQEASISSSFWKPETGQHKVKSLGELEDGEPYKEDGKEEQPRKWLEIQHEGKPHTWSMPFGKTPASIYGQLVHLASVRGKLTNEEFTVIVVGTGQNKRFTVVI